VDLLEEFGKKKTPYLMVANQEFETRFVNIYFLDPLQ
jgi:hypothetical protein